MLTFKNFIVIFLLICVRNFDAREIKCNHYIGVVIVLDENTNNIEYHCKISENVSTVTLVNFSGNQFPNEIFEKFKTLDQIDIVGVENNNLNVFNENFFSGEIQNKIKKLAIYGRTPEMGLLIYQEKLKFEIPAKFPELDYLYIQGIRFNIIQKFKFHEKLKRLNFHLNGLKKIESDTIVNLKNLGRVDFGFNKIQVLEENLFKKNIKLKKVRFNSNQIKEIPRKFFWGLTKLERIDFELNEIEFLHEDLLKDNTNLTLVNFNHNKIQKLSPNFFVNLQNLRDEQFFENTCTEGYRGDLTNCFAQWNNTVNLIEKDKSNCAKEQALGNVHGGRIFARGKYPWAVVNICQQSLTCGGSLISKKHILTAAHCFQNKHAQQAVDPSECYVFLGKHDPFEKEVGAVKKNISRIILHPKWDAQSIHWDNDLAIAFLDSPISYSQYFLPLCLSDRRKNYFYGETATVIGWGLTNDKSEAEDQILELDVNVVSPQTCYSKDRKLARFVSDDASVICAGNRNQTGTCSGDSGSSLFILDEEENDGIYYGIGVVSFGLQKNSACDTTKFQMYTNVENYLEWIQYIVFSTY